jgi:hypothetical protein
VSLHATATVTSKSGNGRPAAKSYSGTNSNGKAPAADVEEAEGVVEGRALLQAAGMQQLTDSLAVLYNMQVGILRKATPAHGHVYVFQQ